MPDHRQHRGAHPGDEEAFAAEARSALGSATDDLSWLLERGYKEESALALVGNRHALRSRQRKAVGRCACSDRALAIRNSLRNEAADLRTADVGIDGFNVVITLESWLSGGVLLRGRDGALRDMASVHGSYRKVEETAPAIALILLAIEELGVRGVRCLFDRPVSNSGRVAGLFREMAEQHGVAAVVECVDDPDGSLVRHEQVVLSSDRWILERAPWFDLPSWLIERRGALAHRVEVLLSEPWLLDLGSAQATAEQVGTQDHL